MCGAEPKLPVMQYREGEPLRDLRKYLGEGTDEGQLVEVRATSRPLSGDVSVCASSLIHQQPAVQLPRRLASTLTHEIESPHPVVLVWERGLCTGFVWRSPPYQPGPSPEGLGTPWVSSGG